MGMTVVVKVSKRLTPSDELKLLRTPTEQLKTASMLEGALMI